MKTNLYLGIFHDFGFDLIPLLEPRLEPCAQEAQRPVKSELRRHPDTKDLLFAPGERLAIRVPRAFRSFFFQRVFGSIL